MTATRWEQIQTLFHAAAEVRQEERASFLEEKCAGDTTLRREVEALLVADLGSDDFLTSTVGDTAVEMLDRQHPKSIGVYSIVRVLGEGGMGTVYLAVRSDDQYRKEVAIKLIRAGWHAPEVVGRFRAERQILADLDHPGIARLLDGGTSSSGTPYLVMEYVDGKNINRYCRERELPVELRLRLFRQVCAAVSYAHRHLIVHRDIKPANILVTADGEPKLLDFGVAKLLTPEKKQQELTRWIDWVMTPEYASPEQIRGETITTSADVYSLGGLLYELLADARPFDLKGKGPAECERLICETMPAKPSSAGARRREVTGDLDSIALKALRKEPARRYESVDQFSDDVQRYLDGLPVQARPDTWSYRASKFVLRHRLAVAAACAFAMTVVAAMWLIVSAERRAEAARAQAQRNFEHVLAMANSSVFEIDESLAALPGSTSSRALLVRKALQYLDLMARENSRTPALTRELASAYEKLSDIQYRDGPGVLGDTAGALASANEALRLRKELVNDPATASELAAEGKDLNRIGDIQRLTRNLGQAAQSYRKALAIFETLGGSESGNQQIRRYTGESYQGLGRAEAGAGDVSAALADGKKGLATEQKLLEDSPSDPSYERDVEQGSLALSETERDSAGDYRAALENMERALAIARKLNAQFPDKLQYKADLASTLSGTGHVYRAMNEPSKALVYYLQSLAVIQNLAAADPTDRRFRRSIGIHSANAAGMLAETGHLREAEVLYRQAVASGLALVGEDSHSRQAKDDLCYARTALGSLLVREGKISEGTGQLKESIALREKLVTEDPENVKWRLRLADTYGDLARAREQSSDCQEANAAYRRDTEILSGLVGKLVVQEQLRKLAERKGPCESVKP